MTRIAPIFDMDETLLAEPSVKLLIDFLRTKGRLWKYVRRRDLIYLGVTLACYRMGMADASGFVQRAARITAGIEATEVWNIVRDWFEAVIRPVVIPGGRAQVDWHRSQGHIPVICSALSQFNVLPVAQYLGISQANYTEWLTEHGRLTSKIRSPITYALGNVHWISEWAKRNDVDLNQSYFYSDHISDRPLLERVGHPVAFNPERRLRFLANQLHWPVHDWTQIATR